MITILNIVLFILLIGASYKDITERRIPNKITFPTILIGWILGGVGVGLGGVFQSFLGTIAGMAIFFIPFALGGMGAGDVKLLGAIGALMGWRFTLLSALYSSIAGLIMALASLIKQGNFKNMVNKMAHTFISLILSFKQTEKLINLQYKYANKSKSYERTYIPYGLAISFGALLVWLNEYFYFLPF